MQALDQLFVARRILGYSYVACFYLFDGVTYADDLTSDQNSLLKNLFEDAQGMLEMEVRLPWVCGLSDMTSELLLQHVFRKASTMTFVYETLVT